MQGEIVRAWYDASAVYAAVAVVEQEMVDGEQVQSRVEYNISLPLTDDLREQVANLPVGEQRAIVEPLMIAEFQRVYAAAHPQIVDLDVSGVVEV